MLKFLRQALASCFGTLIALSLLSILGVSAFALIVVGILASEEETAEIEDQSILVVDLSATIRDGKSLNPLQQAFLGSDINELGLRQVIQAIAQAAEDDRISGILLDGSGGTNRSGYAILKEVRQALIQFRQSDKPIIAYDVDWEKSDYYLGAIADQVIVNPMGGVELNGFSIQQTFFSEALDNLGIGVQIVRVGKYKSAVEPFIQQQFSTENQEQFTALLEDIWGDFLRVTAQNRQKTTQELQNLANSKGLLLASEAKSAGLVDKLAYQDELVERLREITGENEETEEEEDNSEISFQKVSLGNYITETEQDQNFNDAENQIGVIYAQGAIVYGEGEVNQIGSDRMVRQVRKLREDEDIKAVVLRINSPGGSATASELILRELKLLQKEKPVIVSMSNLAASGGYWIALGSDYILAQRNTITGSIGVFGVIPNIQEIANENGVEWDTVKTAPFADANSITRPKTPQEMALLQRFVDQVYDLFLEKVARSRDLPKSTVAEVAQGRVWSGEDAKRLGLVDEIGGLEDAIAIAAEKAELGDDWEVQEYQNEPDWEELLLSPLLGQISTHFTPNSDPLTAELKRLQSEFKSVISFSDPKGIYSRLPFQLKINN